jgi:hypothetical protein
VRPKERSIRDALAAAKDQLGARVIDILPVCAAEGKVYGVLEWLVPRAVATLDEARAVALLRCLYLEADEGKVQKVLGQLRHASQQLKDAAKGPQHIP